MMSGLRLKILEVKMMRFKLSELTLITYIWLSK